MRALIVSVVFALSIAACVPVNTYTVGFKVKLPYDQGTVDVTRNFVLAPEDDEPDMRAYQAVAKNDRKRAIKILKKAIDASPDTARYHHDLAIVYEMNGQWDEAEREAKRAVELASGHTIHLTTFVGELNFIADMKRRFRDPCETWKPGCLIPDQPKR